MHLVGRTGGSRIWRHGDVTYEQRAEVYGYGVTVSNSTPEYIIERAKELCADSVARWARSEGVETFGEMHTDQTEPWESFDDETGESLGWYVKVSAEQAYWPKDGPWTSGR